MTRKSDTLPCGCRRDGTYICLDHKRKSLINKGFLTLDFLADLEDITSPIGIGPIEVGEDQNDQSRTRKTS